MIAYPLLCCLSFLLGAQLQLNELGLLSRQYNYGVQKAQFISFGAAVAGLALLTVDLLHIPFWPWLGLVGAAFVIPLLAEWCLARLSPKHVMTSQVLRFIILLLCACLSGLSQLYVLFPFFVAGLYVRNSPFGVVHGKPLFMAYHCHRKPMLQRVFPTPYQISGASISQINVTDYGILPDTGKDLTDGVQRLIDKVGQEGGGNLFFPKGKYLFNLSGKGLFLQINYSHITIEGETDSQGRLLTEFINGGTTVSGKRNPWLSPFFITTGEVLQPSNQFWGVNFRKPKSIHMESSSLSDPGSDGQILTPPFLTRITSDAPAGSTRLHVEDSSSIGRYVLLCMFNTSPDGKLIKELLGVNELREEWLTARRAGPEEAPSFQWMVEVKEIIDSHTIELAIPLLRDCLMTYEPALYQADLLEDIHIRNIRLNSRWNGLFRHHGFPLYYTIRQTQEMDYGWNAINMKRCAHSSIEQVEILNYSNPVYVQDSYAVDVHHLIVRGYDGHQGLKMYCHTNHCQFHHIDFFCHYADMMGGEGNAYGNTFSDIRYLNPTFKPVDYDFHGFPEGPMAPPAYNRFTRIEGFRFIKSAGAIYNLPSCATHNLWEDTTTEGERHGDPLFYAMTYRVKSGAARIITALGFTVARVLKTKNVSPSVIIRTFLDKLSDIKRIGIPQREHDQFFPFTSIKGIQTTADLSLIRTPSITIVSADAPHEEPLGDGHQPIGEK